MKTCGIYAIRNTVSGRVYVGSSDGIERRWANHRSELKHGRHHSRLLQRSWDKHGKDAFTFEVLEVVPSPDGLFEREQAWFDAFFAVCPVGTFNLHPIAGSPRGHKRPPLTPEQRAAVSKSSTGRRHSAESRAKISAAHTGKKVSPDRLEKMRAIMRERDRSPEMMEIYRRNGLARRGRKASAETKAKMSAAQLGKMPTDETRAKISAGLRGNKNSAGRKLTAETYAKMSAAQLGKTHTDEAKAKMSAAQLGKKLTQEHKAKISAAMLRKKKMDKANAKMSTSAGEENHSAEHISNTQSECAEARAGEQYASGWPERFAQIYLQMVKSSADNRNTILLCS